MQKWIEILRTGTFIDSSGQEHTFTEADLDTIVEKYNPEFHEAPHVIGHPKTNSPAFGWVEALKRDGKKLLCKSKDFVPEFVEMVKKGMFKKRSVSFYSDGTLRHVGWLGAKPPAVKGLSDVAFSDDQEEYTIEFDEYKVSMIGRVLQRMRDFLIDKFDIETADKVISSWEIEELQRSSDKDRLETAAFSSPAHKEGDMGDTKKIQELTDQLEAKSAEFAELSKASEGKDAEIDQLKKDIAGLKQEKRQLEFAEFCEELKADGKLTPAMQPAVLDFMEVLSGIETFEFSDGDGKKEKAPVDAFKSFLKDLPIKVEFEEHATREKAGESGGSGSAAAVSEFSEENVDPDRLDLHSKVVELSEQEGIPYAEALKKIQAEA
jgi:hypothetical protein